MSADLSICDSLSLYQALINVNQGLEHSLQHEKGEAEGSNVSLQLNIRSKKFLSAAERNPEVEKEKRIKDILKKAQENLNKCLVFKPIPEVTSSPSHSLSESRFASASSSTSQSVRNNTTFVESLSSSTKRSSSTASISNSTSGSVQQFLPTPSTSQSTSSSRSPTALSVLDRAETQEDIPRASCGQRFWSVISQVKEKVGIPNAFAAVASIAIGGFFGIAAAVTVAAMYALGRNAGWVDSFAKTRDDSSSLQVMGRDQRQVERGTTRRQDREPVVESKEEKDSDEIIRGQATDVFTILSNETKPSAQDAERIANYFNLESSTIRELWDIQDGNYGFRKDNFLTMLSINNNSNQCLNFAAMLGEIETQFAQ
jgi:hypothetical protein